MDGSTSLTLLGVRIDDVTMSEACDRVSSLVTHDGVHQIATVNPEFIMAARRDPEFARVLSETALNVPDGYGVLWAARRRGRPLRERVAGSDLIVRLCALGSQYRWRVFFLGAREGVAERAAGILAFAYPGLIVAGSFSGSPRREDEVDIIPRVRRARPNLLFVAYGAPEQDKWLNRNLPLLSSIERSEGELPGLVGIGVGGAFDYVAGIRRRAPQWVQQLNLEWLYRLLREPWRWRRQAALFRYALSIMIQSDKGG